MKCKLISIFSLAALLCSVCAGCQARVTQYKVKVIKEYDHDAAREFDTYFFEIF